MILDAKKSLDHLANPIIKSTVTSIGRCLNRDICVLVKRCLQNEFNLDTFNNYFEIIHHKMNTRNYNHSIRLTRLKLELARQGFFAPVAVFATPCHWNCGSMMIICCLRASPLKQQNITSMPMKEHFKYVFSFRLPFRSLYVIIALRLPVLQFK